LCFQPRGGNALSALFPFGKKAVLRPQAEGFRKFLLAKIWGEVAAKPQRRILS